MTGVTLEPGEVLLVAARGTGEDRGLWLWSQGPDGWHGRIVDRVADLSSLAGHPTLPVVYGTDGDERVLGWRIDATGEARIAEGPSGGAEPCHLAVDPSGGLLVICNYAGGTLGLQRLGPDGGFVGAVDVVALTGSGPEVDRQEAAHPHQAVFDGARLFVIDLGADLVREYRLDLSRAGAGVLVEVGLVPVPPGTGPRHGVMLPGGRMAVSGELGETLIVGHPGDWGVVRSTGLTGPGRARWERNYPGDIARSGDGRLVYLANRSHGTVAVMDVTGAVAKMVGEIDTGVDWPQHLLVRDGALIVAGWDSGRVAVLTLEDGLPVQAATLFDCAAPGWLHVMRRG
jgi:6-phosphogluconolactonase (cycloisomerase 2 family)